MVHHYGRFFGLYRGLAWTLLILIYGTARSNAVSIGGAGGLVFRRRQRGGFEVAHHVANGVPIGHIGVLSALRLVTNGHDTTRPTPSKCPSANGFTLG